MKFLSPKKTFKRRWLFLPLAIAPLIFISATAGGVDAAPWKFDHSEEFNGPAGSQPDPKLWMIQTGGSGWGNNEVETYTDRPSNISLNGKGQLAITARRETYTGTDGITRNYTSGRITSLEPIKYGAVVARIKLPEGQGLWPAFWTVGTDILTKGWPRSGEIDIMEALNKMPTVFGTLHGPTTTGNAYGVGKKTSPADGVGGEWHTYGINWSPLGINWYLDGHRYGRITKASLPATDQWEFDKPHVVQLNLAVGGDWPGPPNSTTPATSTMLVDYVRYYSNW
ncbi:beta-glucanase (GH16 family) [Jatrophihabitans sp. GAS493]|uniref:glycoside hydrolase family 16 protein n=1 Tax=Jatrophihabitans sp. GAS493 TaxID=1907575 RepID=UPI000BBFBD5D|nr:glycoside hydrolase family 16 protein [Jatrophihabitans sp. GAS493]SOD71566.1 beta-glucanase (GH16 family) [Jatrophihabitans sp. GAS493]